jgi:hypothetical protein
VEIKRFVTYIGDEKVFLDGKVIEVEARDPHLAFFVREYQPHWGRFDEGHINKLTEMASKLGGVGLQVPYLRGYTLPRQ